MMHYCNVNILTKDDINVILNSHTALVIISVIKAPSLIIALQNFSFFSNEGSISLLLHKLQ